jgi:mono/diheme cytochrome c family protein
LHDTSHAVTLSLVNLPDRHRLCSARFVASMSLRQMAASLSAEQLQQTPVVRAAALTDIKYRAPGGRILSARPDLSGRPSSCEEMVMRATGFWSSMLACMMLSMAAAAVAQQQQDLGKREYDSKCAVCHGKDGKGGGPYSADLKRSPADLTTLAQRNGGVFPAPRIYDIIEGSGAGHGTREMPVWGWDYTIRAAELFPDNLYNQASYVRARIAALVDYLEQLQAK